MNLSFLSRKARTSNLSDTRSVLCFQGRRRYNYSGGGDSPQVEKGRLDLNRPVRVCPAATCDLDSEMVLERCPFFILLGLGVSFKVISADLVDSLPLVRILRTDSFFVRDGTPLSPI